MVLKVESTGQRGPITTGISGREGPDLETFTSPISRKLRQVGLENWLY